MKLPQLHSVPFVEKLMFTKHLSIMIKSGVPIYEAIDTLGSHAKSKYFRKILKNILKDIENGKSLYQALAKYPHVFDKFYTSLIKVSEESGTLEETLNFLSEQLAKDYALKKKIQGAMFYPGVILVAGVSISAFISVFVLPQLVDFFDALEVELPMPTKILLFVANLMKHQGVLIFASLFGFMFLFRILISTNFFKPVWDKFLLFIPVLGKLIKYGQLARFCRNLATLIKSGVPITEGLKTASDTMSNEIFKRYLKRVREDLIKGQSISASLEKRKFREIPPMMVRMIAVGERTGNLEEVLLYLDEFYEDEVDDLAKNLTTILEPILLVGIGAMVAFIAIAIIGPIYKVTGNIQ